MVNEENNKYVERLREEYTEHKRDKLDELHELDNKVKLPANVFVYTFGIIGALVLGAGMCLAMGVIGASLSFAIPLGVVVGLVGIICVVANYFIYRAILNSRKKKYAAQILSISDELLNK